MQNRRIIDRLLVNAAAPPLLESNCMLVLFSHVRIGAPEKLASLLSLREPLRAIPILEPQEIYTIGLVSPRQEPIPPLRGHSQPKRANWRCPKTKDLDAILIDRFFHGWLR